MKQRETPIICKECGDAVFKQIHGWCKKCYSKFYRRVARKENPEQFRKYDKSRWKGKRREISNKQRLERYHKNIDEERKKRKAYKEKNKEKIRKQQKEYYQRNLDTIRKRNREYNKRRDKIKEFKRLYEWVEKQPVEKLRETWRRQSQIKAARKKNLPATLTIEEWEEIKVKYNHRCIYCGKIERLTQDHDIPITRGGAYTKENIVPACLSCNSKKKNKTGKEYMEYLKSKK